MSETYKYLFGPVPSRRLGRSLGVDLIPFKTCTMDCTYCQLGEPTCGVSERGDYVPMQNVLAELGRWNAVDEKADHITLAGSGEPTLHLYFGDVFRWVKENTNLPSVLLTNGSLMHDADVRAQAALADKVKVTLSAWDEESFRQIHRPAQGIDFGLLVKGEQLFRQKFGGELSVEVFIIDGINSGEAEARRISEIVKTINPGRIEINTAVRPLAVKGVEATSNRQLNSIAENFGERASVVTSFKEQDFIPLDLDEDRLLRLLKRHPATCKQLAREFNLPEKQIDNLLNKLVVAGMLKKTGTMMQHTISSVSHKNFPSQQ